MAYRILFISFIIIFGSYNAQSQTNQITSSENEPASLIERVLPDNSSYFSWLSGPNLGGVPNQLDENGQVKENSLATWSQVSLLWKTSNDDYQIVMNNPFIINHNPSAEDDTYALLDATFGIRGLWFKSGKLSIGGMINTFTPVTQLAETRQDKILFNPGGFQALNYQVNNRLSIGGWLWFRAYIYGRPTTSEDNRTDFFVAPIVSFKVNDWYTISSFYQFNGANKRSFKTTITPDDSINLKQAFRINKYLTVEPFFTLYRESNYSFSKGNLNVWLSGNLF